MIELREESRVPCYLDYNWPAASVVNLSLRQNGIGSLFVNEYIKIHPVSSSGGKERKGDQKEQWLINPLPLLFFNYSLCWSNKGGIASHVL